MKQQDADRPYRLPWHCYVRAWELRIQHDILYWILRRFPTEWIYTYLLKYETDQGLWLGPYDKAHIHVETDNPERPTYDVEVDGIGVIACERGYKRL